MKTHLLIVLLLTSFIQPAILAKDYDVREVIIEKALESIYNQYNSDEYRFVISTRWIPNRILTTEPSNILSVELEGNLERYSNLEVTYLRRKKSEKVSVQIIVETEQRIPVPIERLVSGEVISRDKLQIQWTPIVLEREKVISSINDLEGKILKRTVHVGQSILESYISTEVLIEAGDVIQMVFNKHGIELVLTCEARQNGAYGEEIQVYSKETRKKYTVVVIDQGKSNWKRTL